MKNQTKLTSIQLIFFMIQTQIGVGILGLPFNVISVSKQDGWISVLLSGVFVQILITLLWILAKRFPEKSIFQYSTVLTGKVIGTVINISYIVYGLLVTSLILMSAAAIIKMWALPLSPKWIIMFMLISTAVYLGKENIEVISNIYVVISSLILLLIIISIVVLFVYPVEWIYLLPIGQSGWIPIFKGMNEAYFSMLGFELILIVYPYFQRNGDKSIYSSVTMANFSVTLTYAFLTIVTLMTFSPAELKIIPQPVLYFVKSLYLQIVERIDLLFVSLWVVNVITSLTSYLFLSTEGSVLSFKRFKKVKRSLITIGFGALACCLAMVPQKPTEMDMFNKAVINASYLFVLIIPILFLMISLILKKKERGKEK